MAKKKTTGGDSSSNERTPTVSQLRPGGGSKRIKTRFITVYGPPKTRKTTAVSRLPIGRTKWLVSDSNCLGVETKFITHAGVKSFADFKDGDRTMVLTPSGAWMPATVRSYGSQQLYEVQLGRGRNVQHVRATAGHRWMLESKKILSTDQLQLGDKLHKPPHLIKDWCFEEAPEAEQAAWVDGFVFGDGSKAFSHGKELGSKLRLCGEKAKFRERFEQLGVEATYPASADGDPCFYLPGVFKRLPQLDVGVGPLTAFVRGWLDADGTKNQRHPGSFEVNPFCRLQVTGAEAVAFARNALPMVGAYIVDEVDLTEQVTNYGARTDTTVGFSIVMGFSNSPVAPYNVRSVTKDVTEEVWCLEVPNAESFVLPSGIVTMNCVPTLRSLDRLPADEDIYEVKSLTEAVELMKEMVALAREQGHDALGIDFLVVDSLTQFSDWHQKLVAEQTGQRFMGDSRDGSGWMQFNAEFSELLDLMVLLSQEGVNVVAIAHSKDKLPKGKGEWAVLNLPPQMAAKAARLSNWILFKRLEELVREDPDAEVPESENLFVHTDETGKKSYFIDVLRTVPLDGWTASVNSLKLNPDEPGDLVKLLEKDGLL